MKYKEKISGVRSSKLQSIDLSVVAAMALLIVLAWSVAKLERSFTRTARVIPTFSVSQEISVMPIEETRTKKEAAMVGKFMSLSKTNTYISPQIQTEAVDAANNVALKNIILSQGIPSGIAVSSPRIIYKTIPDYPAKAIENSQQGTVVVRVYILKNGRVGDAAVDMSSGSDILDKSAVSAISQWIFEPATYEKQITESWFKVPVKFQLKS
jgi:TonB family protein